MAALAPEPLGASTASGSGQPVAAPDDNESAASTVSVLSPRRVAADRDISLSPGKAVHDHQFSERPHFAKFMQERTVIDSTMMVNTWCVWNSGPERALERISQAGMFEFLRAKRAIFAWREFAGTPAWPKLFRAVGGEGRRGRPCRRFVSL